MIEIVKHRKKKMHSKNVIFKMEQQRKQVQTKKCENVVPSKRNSEKMKVLFLRKGTTENESVVPSEWNNRK